MNKFKVLIISGLVFLNTYSETRWYRRNGIRYNPESKMLDISQKLREISLKYQELMANFAILKKQNFKLKIENAKLQQQVLMEHNRIYYLKMILNQANRIN